jgi:uncharacterized protein YprB with RNaseH-like and TPR domain
MRNWTDAELEELVIYKQQGLTWNEISEKYLDETPNSLRKTYYRFMNQEEKEVSAPKVLLLDIESLPMEVFAWGLFDQNIGLEMVKTDWSILSFSAKWLDAPEDEIMYYDTRNEENVRDDSKLVKIIHGLLDECDVTITQNGVRFDIPKLNARFIKHGLKPPSSFRNIDTLRIAKSKFGFTSNKLAYMTEFLCEKYKKLDHSEFAGFKLWNECMKGNLAAFESMEKYNKYDVLSLEELYYKLAPWDKTINFSVFNEDLKDRCQCGSTDIKPHGFVYTNLAKYQRYICSDCGKETRDSQNLISKEKRKTIKR